MRPIIPVNVSAFAIYTFRDLGMGQRESVPEPPELVDGCTAGIISMDRDPPHGGDITLGPNGDHRPVGYQNAA